MFSEKKQITYTVMLVLFPSYCVKKPRRHPASPTFFAPEVSGQALSEEKITAPSGSTYLLLFTYSFFFMRQFS